MSCDRTTLLFAYAWYVMHWGPTRDRRAERVVNRYRVSLGMCARFETADQDVKEAYGRIVRKNEGLYVGYERLYRRGKVGPWPGTQNLPRGDARAWLRSQGLLEAVEAVAP